MKLDREKLLELAAQVDAATGEDNALDVLCEVALFKPSSVYSIIRANSAGTKVIYTDKAGNRVTCWAEPWSTRALTASTLRALAGEAE